MKVRNHSARLAGASRGQRRMQRPRYSGSRAGAGRRPGGGLRYRGRPRARTGVLVAAGCILAVALLGMAAALAAQGAAGRDTEDVALQLIATRMTANDAAIALPGQVKSDLESVGLAHEKVAVTLVDANGDTSTSIVDLTPRTGDSTKDPVLKVDDRALAAVDKKIADIERTINTSPASTGGRSLYSGLTKVTFRPVPTLIVSSGLDLSSPDDFRALAWSVAPSDVVAKVKGAGVQPAIHGPVTFLLVPTSGTQPQLGQAQKDYRNAVWNALLTSAGATSVSFVDAGGTEPAASVEAPAVPVPALPSTPIARTVSPADPKKVTCTVPSSYFVPNTPQLLDPAGTTRDLAPCIQQALAENAAFSLDGWTAYFGPLDANGRPAVDDPGLRALSSARVGTIADLMTSQLGVPPAAITARNGHGNTDQPDPDPHSEKNRVVVVTYTVK